MLVGCGSKLPTILHEPPKKQNLNKVITGQYQALSGEVVGLSAVTKNARVMTFSTSSCLTCREEAEEISGFIQEHGARPTKVELVTIMVGDVIEDLIGEDAFFQWGELPWTIGMDIDAQLFGQYCDGETPCTIIETPEQGIVFQHTGMVGVKKLQEVTGAWY